MSADPPRTTDYHEDDVRRAGAPRLEVVRGTVPRGPIDLSPGTLLVGRDEEADLRFDSVGVSRKHARLRIDEQGMVELFDLQSRNGSFVNGQRVDRLALRVGDELRFGEVVLRLTVVGHVQGGEEPAGPMRAKVRPPGLSDREFEVASLAAEGLTNAEIGRRLDISGATVGRHLSNIYERLNIHSRVALVRMLTGI